MTRSDTNDDAKRLAPGNRKHTVGDMDLIALVLGTALWLAVSYIGVRLFVRRAVSRAVAAAITGCGLPVGLLVAGLPAPVAGPSWLFVALLLGAALTTGVMAYLIAPMFQAA